MKYLLVFLLALFANPLFADAISDGKAVLDALSQYGPNPKTLTNAQMLDIVDRYNTVNGFSNPWSEEDNPAEYAAWPTNLEKATFFLQRLRGEIASDIGRKAGEEYDATASTARATAVKNAQDAL